VFGGGGVGGGGEGVWGVFWGGGGGGFLAALGRGSTTVATCAMKRKYWKKNRPISDTVYRQEEFKGDGSIVLDLRRKRKMEQRRGNKEMFPVQWEKRKTRLRKGTRADGGDRNPKKGTFFN